MSSTHLSSLLKRRTVSLILICVIIGVPIIVLGHAELFYGGYGSTPSSSVEVYSLEDVWYPRNPDWQPNPLLIKGNMSAYYSRPVLMVPNNVVIEIFVEDVTNSSSDLSAFDVFDYTFLQDNGYVNTTLTPLVSGDFGDGEDYTANETGWTYWTATGLPKVYGPLGRGISNKNFDMTGNQSGDRYSICSLEFAFNTDTSLRVYQWSVLFELAIIQEGALQLAGHGMRITVETKMTWIPVLAIGLPGSYVQSLNITRGDGVADNGVEDY